MRIAYFINSMEGGGAQSPLPLIVAALERAGAEVRVFALTRRNGKAITRLQEHGIDPLVRDGGESDHFAALGWMEQQACEWSADVIWTSLTRATLLGQIAGSRTGLPVVSWQHNAFLKPWNERLLRWRTGNSALWVADSADVAELTAKRLGVPRESLVTWPIFAVDPNAPLAKPWREGETVRIGSLGRLHPNKGYDFLIDALTLLKQRGFMPAASFSVAIGGTGNDGELLRLRAKQAGIDTIKFSGFVDDPASFLASLHLYVQPSRREGFCIAAHEAMQAGLPVIVSQTGQMPITVDSLAIGRSVPVGDVTALADALTGMLTSPEALSDMGLAARKRVLDLYSRERFDAVGAQLVRRIDNLIKAS